MGLVRWVMNSLSGIIAVVSVISIILGVFLVNDIAEFRTQFYDQGGVMYLDIDHRIESGFTVDNADEEAVYNPIPLSQLYDMTEFYIDEAYPLMLADKYKLFIFTEEAFANVEKARINEYEFDTEDVLALIKSHTLSDDFEDVTGILPEDVFGSASDDDMRWKLFARLVFTQVEDEGPMFLLHGIRDGNIIVYPKTITFQLAPLIPLNLFDWLASPDRVRRISEAV